jgi:spore coat polysaccharide biosynthesis protein SpsF (cytidylyltransferase family)
VILTVLQARMGSTRLPGKVMLPLLGEPMLFRQIERIARASRIDKLVVATTTDADDDVLAGECARRRIAVYRGSASDVLDRFVRAAEAFRPRAVVRLTGDCPLIDWRVIDFVVETYLKGDVQYASNIDPPTYPDGLDVEIVDYAALRIADAEALLPSQREHVTTFIREHKSRFSAANVSAEVDLSAHRWTVDEPADFALVRDIYENLHPRNASFETADILEHLRAHPELTRLNRHIVRNAGLRQSEAADGILVS